MNSIFFINYKYFKIISVSFLLITFIFASVLGGVLVPKKVEAGIASSIINGILKPFKDALSFALKIAIPALTDFVKKNLDIIIVGAGAWAWYATPSSKMEEIQKSIKAFLYSTLITLITNDIITSIQGGEPTFIGNWSKFRDDLEDRAVGKFLNELAGFDLCGISAPNIKVLFKSQEKFKDKIECTLSDIEANITGIFDDLTTNGLGSWVKLTNQPQNNYYGQYYMLQAKKLDDIAKGVDSGKSEAISGGGFTGRKCTKEEAEATPPKCKEGEILTPGSLIAGTAQEMLNAPGKFISTLASDATANINDPLLKQSVDAIITAFLSEMLKTTMQGFLGRSPATDYENSVSVANNVQTPQSIDVFFLPLVRVTRTSLVDLNILTGKISNFLSTSIKIKEENLLDNSKKLFDKEPICSLPDFETSLKTSEAVSGNIINQEFTLNATGIGKVLLTRTVTTATLSAIPTVTATVSSRTAEIIPEIPFYETNLPLLLTNAITKTDAYISVLNTFKNNPISANRDAINPAKQIVVDSINNILALQSLSATNLDDALIFLQQVSDFYSKKFGQKEFEGLDPDDPAIAGLNPDSYYYKSNIIIPGLDLKLTQAITVCN